MLLSVVILGLLMGTSILVIGLKTGCFLSQKK